MSQCLKNEVLQPITLIRGDDLTIKVNLKINVEDVIEHVYLICSDLNLQEELSLNTVDETTKTYTYTGTISKEKTMLFTKESCDYDIKVVFKSGQIFTPIYQNPFITRVNKNKLNE